MPWARRNAGSGFAGVVDEGRDVGFELGKVFVPDIHHMAGIVILESDVVPEVGRDAEVVHGLFGRKKRRGQVVNAVFHFDSQMRVGDHGFDQIGLHVR